MVDNDIGFSADDVQHAIASKLDVVGGAVPIRVPPGAPARFAFHPAGEIQDVGGEPRLAIKPQSSPGRPYLLADHVGTGHLLIRRHVALKLVELFGDERRYTTDAGEVRHDFFATEREPWRAGTPGEGSSQLLSEDYAFCRLLQRGGFKLHVALAARFTHTGMHTWSTSLIDELKSMRADREAAE